MVERFLLDAAARSVFFAHMLICQLLSEGTPPEEAFNPTVCVYVGVMGYEGDRVGFGKAG